MHRVDERGATTAEYGIGTVGAVLIATILYRLGTMGGEASALMRLARGLLTKAFDLSERFGWLPWL